MVRLTGAFARHLYPEGIVETALAVMAGVLLAAVGFRRARRVVSPEARRAAPLRGIGSRSRRFATAALTVTRVAVGVAALVGIVWLTKQLFT
jgi:hypothetical protein